MKWYRGIFYALLVAALNAGAAETKTTQPWKIEHLSQESVIEWEEDADVVTARNGVRIEHGTSVLTADRVTLNRSTGWVMAEGNVSLRSQGHQWRGEQLRYNFVSESIEGENFRTGAAPFFAAGGGLSAGSTNQVYSTRNAYITTDDVENPGYRVRARSLTIYPGKAIEARGATVMVGKTSVFYFPFYRRSLERHPNNFAFTPGFRSSYGPYLLSAFNWTANTNLSGSINLDYRVRRGVAGGPDFHADFGRWGRGNAEFYFLRDEDPDTDPQGRQIRDYRHRINVDYMATLRTNLTGKVVIRENSDAQVVRDFFEAEYRKNIHPASFLELNQAWPDFSLNLIAQPQFNEFYETVERLPEIRLDAFRQQLGHSPLYYESQSSLGYYHHRFVTDPLTDFAAYRGDTYHQVVLPQNYFGWLNVVPRVGGRWTHYGEVEGPGTTMGDQGRGVFNTGAEVSTKASRVWTGVKNKFFEVDQLRHIFEPSVNYVYVPEPNKRPPELPQFDSQLPTLRLLPIEYPDYNAIDSIDSQNVIRFGIRNKLQTKRAGEVENVVNWAMYTDWRLRPRQGQSTFADFYSDLDFKPKRWLTFNSEVRFDMSNEEFRAANHTATISPNTTWSWSIGHRYLQDAPLDYGTGNNLIISSFYYRINENWASRVSHHFEARDGTLEEQYYTIHRDLRSWTSSLTFRVLNHRDRPTDFSVGVVFSLKAFPRFKVGEDRNNPSLLLGS